MMLPGLSFHRTVVPWFAVSDTLWSLQEVVRTVFMYIPVTVMVLLAFTVCGLTARLSGWFRHVAIVVSAYIVLEADWDWEW